MPDNQNRKIMLPRTPGVLQDLATRVRLILRLLADARVSPWLKVLPVASAVYLLFPDLAPGPIDDAAIIWLSTYLFVELCPPDVVQEHMKALQGTVPGEWRDASSGEEGEIIEGEIVEDNPPQDEEQAS